MVELKWNFLLIIPQILRIDAVTRQQIREQTSNLLRSKCPVKITTMRVLEAYGICKMPYIIPNGRLLSVDGLKEGSKAEFICDDYHFTNITHGVCRADGTWEGLEKPCVVMSNTSLVLKAMGRLIPGRCVVILAVPRDGTPQFFVELFAEDGNTIIFHSSIRFDEKSIVRNAFINNKWGREEKQLNFWPFEYERESNVKLCVEDDLYRYHVDGKELFTFKHRLQGTQVKLICITHSKVRRVDFIEV